ncbi:hypothetical protein Ahy_B05g075100 [Arachis hypogaea]|uniref:Aminotransferase-like plant mobile domain-containing protein n=1 Tax=Arachis hypogaea TaxID=3818 RepID=A0A444Z0I4_ARAHY|nr:hypothetical protein Ahy_B05g075100 [Arachis hypogaea]
MIRLYKEFKSASFEPFFISPTPQNPRENDPDSLRRRPERKTLLMGDDPARLYRLDGVAHIAGVINDEPQRCIRSMRRQQGMRLDDRYVQKYAVNCSWFQETFGECPKGADDETVRRYARAYIMMLLGTQLFADKSGNRIHIRWLPYVARLEEMGTYSWGSAALAWLYRCMSVRHSAHAPVQPCQCCRTPAVGTHLLQPSYVGKPSDVNAVAGLVRK